MGRGDSRGPVAVGVFVARRSGGARFALAVPVLLLLTLVPTGTPAVPTHSVPFAAMFLLLIVLLPDLLGMVLYYFGLRGTPASVATLAELCYPLTALAIGVFVQHTPMSRGEWLGLGLLVVRRHGSGPEAGRRAPTLEMPVIARRRGYDRGNLNIRSSHRRHTHDGNGI